MIWIKHHEASFFLKLLNWIQSMAMLMNLTAIAKMARMAMEATIVMAIGNFSMAIKGFHLKSIKN